MDSKEAQNDDTDFTRSESVSGLGEDSTLPPSGSITNEGDVEKVPANKEEPLAPSNPVSATPPAPDGGLQGWIQCMASFFLYMNSWGLVNSFGVYQSFYEQSLISSQTPSNISWIGSIQAFLLIFCGIVAGPLYDMGYLRHLVITGSFLLVIGMVFTSLCTTYWQLVLAQGIVVGLGNGCMFIPSIAIIPTYFTSRRALAMGIAASGSSIGGLLYPIIFRRLEPKIGFGWATRVIALIMLITLIIAVLSIKQRLKPSSTRSLFEAAAWKEIPYSVFAGGVFLGFMGLYVPFFYVQTYSLEKKIVDADFAFYLLPLLNAGSFFGRIIPPYIADKVGPFNTLVPSALLAAILILTWISIHSTPSLIVYCLFYGFFSGTFVSLAPTVTVSLCPSMKVVGVRIGMICIPISLGLLIGNPIAGALLKGSWVHLQVFSGVVVAASALFIGISRGYKTNWVPVVKV